MFNEFVESFTEEPGYLDFATLGPLGRAVKDEQYGLAGLLGRARFGTLASLDDQDLRARHAVGMLTGFDSASVVLHRSAGEALSHVLAGIVGTVAIAREESPAAALAADWAVRFGRLSPRWLQLDHEAMTPGTLRDQLDTDVLAVVVSAVDRSTGRLCDLDGIRQVIGDRLLIVDATGALGVVDAPFALADVLVGGGEAWLRAGPGTGYLALSDSALERVQAVLSRIPASSPATAAAFSAGEPDPIAACRLAAAVEQIAAIGVQPIAESVAEKVSRVIELADEFAVAVTSPRQLSERAGIVVLEPPAEQLTTLAASLFNHGVSVGSRPGRVLISPHVSTSEETFEVLRASLVAFSVAASL